MTSDQMRREIRRREIKFALTVIQFLAAAGLAVCLAGTARAAPVGIDVPPECEVITVSSTKWEVRCLGDDAPPPSPAQSPRPGATPTPKPGPTPPPPKGCTQVVNLDKVLGDRGLRGVANVQIREGEKHCYRAVTTAARRVRFEISRQCLTADVLMDVFPGAASYSDGKAIPIVLDNTRSANFGSLTMPPGYVPAQTFTVEVEGKRPDIDCPKSSSWYTLALEVNP